MSHHLRPHKKTIPSSLSIALLLLTAVMTFTPHSSYSLDSDREQTLYLSADSANIDNAHGKGVFRGQVELNQGTTHLRAHQATTFTDKNNQLKKAIALGNKQKQAHYWTLSDPKKPELHAYANVIEYYPKENKIILIGNARVVQGQDSYTAPRIEYDTMTQGVTSVASKLGRTTITIHPSKTQA